MKRPRSRTGSRIAAAISSSCNTFPHSLSGLLVVKIIGRFFRCRSFTTWKSTLACNELLFEILLIMEAPHFEEGRFYEAHQVLDGLFLVRLLRPTQLHSDAQLQHGVSEDRI